MKRFGIFLAVSLGMIFISNAEDKKDGNEAKLGTDNNQISIASNVVIERGLITSRTFLTREERCWECARDQKKLQSVPVQEVSKSLDENKRNGVFVEKLD